MLSHNPPGGAPVPRDVEGEYRKSIDDAIASYTDQGREAPAHLLSLRAEITAQELPPEKAVADAPESKVADPAPEKAVPRTPGRPRKHDASPAGS